MDSKFIVAIRRATRNLPPSDEVINEITNLRVELVWKAEAIILKNENIGRRFLVSNIKEIDAEFPYIEVLIDSRLKEMQQKGLDEYNADFSNTRAVSLAMEDALGFLSKLWKIYFKDSESQDDKAGSTTIIQTAEKIYNIDNIDNANFS